MIVGIAILLYFLGAGLYIAKEGATIFELLVLGALSLILVMLMQLSVAFVKFKKGDK